jgi:hypothetical protein
VPTDFLRRRTFIASSAGLTRGTIRDRCTATHLSARYHAPDFERVIRLPESQFDTTHRDRDGSMIDAEGHGCALEPSFLLLDLLSIHSKYRQSRHVTGGIRRGNLDIEISARKIGWQLNI